MCNRKACCTWQQKTVSAFWLGNLGVELPACAPDSLRRPQPGTSDAKGQGADCVHERRMYTAKQVWLEQNSASWTYVAATDSSGCLVLQDAPRLRSLSVRSSISRMDKSVMAPFVDVDRLQMMLVEVVPEAKRDKRPESPVIYILMPLLLSKLTMAPAWKPAHWKVPPTAPPTVLTSSNRLSKNASVSLKSVL